MTSDQLLARVEEFRVAYNSVDVQTLKNLVSDDIHWEHHNRFKGSGKDGLMASIIEYAEKMPGRYFDPPVRSAIDNQTAYVEHIWRATPTRSDPAWGWEEGVPTSMDVCSVYVFEGGKLVEWSDYA